MKSLVKIAATIVTSIALITTAGCEVSFDTGTENTSGIEKVYKDPNFKTVPGTTQKSLNKIKIANKQYDPTNPYNRLEFPHWGNPGQLGWKKGFNTSCDVRGVVAERDAHNVGWYDETDCWFDEGTYWKDEYGVNDGGEVTYLKSNDPADFDVDHIVALGESWKSGSAKWSTKKRELFANDPLNLEISAPSANRGKGDKSADVYLPPGKFRCEYVQRYAQVKAKYKLTMTETEMTRLQGAAKKCGN